MTIARADGNYLDPLGPRYAGCHAHERAAGLRLVTFNVRYGRRVDRAEELFQKADHLRGADVIVLQEMDAPGTETLARALGYDYVYYPGARHSATGRDFGNAVLTRWPIQADHKLVLPHLSGLRRMARAATAADLRLPAGPVRVYSVHLATPAELLPRARAEQALAIANDARGFRGAVIVAGDFNSRDRAVGVFERAGFTWLTRDLGATLRFFCWDHVFARGLEAAAPRGRGIVADNNGASDHLPVWVDLPLPASS